MPIKKLLKSLSKSFSVEAEISPFFGAVPKVRIYCSEDIHQSHRQLTQHIRAETIKNIFWVKDLSFPQILIILLLLQASIFSYIDKMMMLKMMLPVS